MSKHPVSSNLNLILTNNDYEPTFVKDQVIQPNFVVSDRYGYYKIYNILYIISVISNVEYP